MRIRNVHVIESMCWKTVFAISLFCAVAAIASQAQTFTTLTSFNSYVDGGAPYGSLAQGFDGNFYGTTSSGGSNGTLAGTVFRMTPEGTLTVIYAFCSQINCADGENPFGGLVLGTDGNFYGTTLGGGTFGTFGTVFKITSGGQLTTLHSFQGSDGVTLFFGLAQATDGNFYGTTYEGGSSTNCPAGCGTVFQITPAGSFTMLHSFCPQSGCADGSAPQGLLPGSDGNLYGTTGSGGANGMGTIFRITPGGAFTTLHSFNGADGNFPIAALVQAGQSNFGYGATATGGTQSNGTLFSSTATGNVTTLYNFCSQTNCADGRQPSGLIRATDANIYGTTLGGGSSFSGGGILFGMTPTGKFHTLHTFCASRTCADGEAPRGGLIQGTDGSIYGTTQLDGTAGGGTVFRLTVGLAPFVRTSPSFGSAGATVVIFGTNLTGATAVSFNGTTASFTVVSGTEITATVPSGATSGTVAVTTPGGTLTSNVPFQVAK